MYLLYLYNYKLLYKFNQTVQINKNPQPDRPEGQLIKRSRAWAVLVRRPEDSNHKRFFVSFFAFSRFRNFRIYRILNKIAFFALLHFEKKISFYAFPQNAKKSRRTRFFSRIAFAFDFQKFFAFASHSILSAQSASSGELAELASSASSAQRNFETSQLS